MYLGSSAIKPMNLTRIDVTWRRAFKTGTASVNFARTDSAGAGAGALPIATRPVDRISTNVRVSDARETWSATISFARITTASTMMCQRCNGGLFFY